jgi:high-affinity Fe2+/Pb2+ permease
MLTIPATLAGYMAVGTGLAMAATSGAAGLFTYLGLFKGNTQAFNWVVRAVNMLLILLVVVLSEVTLGTFNLHNWLAYIQYAVQAFSGAQLLYIANTARIKIERDAAIAQNQPATVTISTTPNQGIPNSPVTFQPAGAAHDQH